jgi:hypothetical protein
MQKLGLTLILLSVLGCTTTLDDYSDTQPQLELDSFFNGELKAWGIVQGRSGKVTRTFVAELNGQWQGNQGVLDERFIYNDGEQQHRIWNLTKLENGRYSGTANDVPTPANGGTNGIAMNWQYSVLLEVDGTTWNINFDDWMYLVDENSVINKAALTKFGFKVGEVTLFIQKLPPA